MKFKLVKEDFGKEDEYSRQVERLSNNILGLDDDSICIITDALLKALKKRLKLGTNYVFITDATKEEFLKNFNSNHPLIKSQTFGSNGFEDDKGNKIKRNIDINSLFS